MRPCTARCCSTAPRERRWATRDEELKEKYILHYIEATDVLS